MSSPPKVALSQLSKSTWEQKGLRGFLEYRDLGTAKVTGGRFGASVGRALHAFKPGADAPTHYHSLGFHFIYILKGWMRTQFDGLGEVVLHAGDCISYEGEILQAHVEYSEDYEVLQVTAPAEFATVQVGADGDKRQWSG
jgi:quercetin dioxygenase-like cupin family protein